VAEKKRREVQSGVSKAWDYMKAEGSAALMALKAGGNFANAEKTKDTLERTETLKKRRRK
jgi:hypothetical protein